MALVFVYALVVAAPLLLLHIIFRFLRAYERRGNSESLAARMDMVRLEGRMAQLEESVRKLREQLEQKP
jgi:hypothetical protein